MSADLHPAVAEYVAGNPVRAIIARHRIATHTLYLLLAEAGVPRRSSVPLMERPVPGTAHAPYKQTSLKQLEIRALLESGQYARLSDIARAVGVSPSYVSRLSAQLRAERGQEGV